MFKNMSVPKKISFGFGAVLLFLAVIAGVSLMGIGGIVKNAGNVIGSTDLNAQMLQREIDHLNWASSVSESITDPDKRGQKLEVQTDPHKCAFGKWYYSDERKRAEELVPELKDTLASIEEPHNMLHKSAIQINENIEDHDKVMDTYIKNTVPELHQVQKQLGQVREIAGDNLITDDQMLAAASNTRIAVAALSGIIIVLGIVLAFAIVRGIVGPMRRIIDNLSSGAEQMTAASSQISGSSQSLAEGAAEQASSLEETSSSIEEMTSMTRQNAENADQADKLAREARRAAESGNEATARMIEAVKRISESADQTSKIIKTIDEIAFQTNLLALNAAVEAARAGEAGKGFAVVAEEVRNLAQRAGEAARNTSVLIEGSVNNTNQGVKIADEVAKSLSEITEGAIKVSDLVAEIAAASKEQAQGLGQVSNAVAEMDRVTQSNASNAEESASASEEMYTQAESVKDMVGDMVAMMGARLDVQQSAPAATRGQAHAARRPLTHQAIQASFAGNGNGNGYARDRAAMSSMSKTPAQTIPFHEANDDFQEF